MSFKPQAGDVVLARFFIGGSSDKAIRYIKRKGKLYQVNDLHYYKPDYRLLSTGVTHIDNMVEVTREEILKKVREAMEATLNGDEETYEIWVNDYIYHRLFKD